MYIFKNTQIHTSFKQNFIHIVYVPSIVFKYFGVRSSLVDLVLKKSIPKTRTQSKQRMTCVIH